METILMNSAKDRESVLVRGPLRVLIVENSPLEAELVVACLERAGYALSFDIVELPGPFREKLKCSEYDLVIADHNLGSWRGMEALEILHDSGKQIPFIVVAASQGDEVAVEYVKKGASDYVLKNHLALLPVAVASSLRDKVQRDEVVQLQASILECKKEWELTFDSVPDAMVIIDRQSRVQQANHAATELLATPRSKLIGRSCDEAVCGLAGTTDCGDENLIATSVVQRKDVEDPRSKKIFDVTSSPLRNSDGTLLGCIQVMRDVTGRKRAEQALQYSMDRYRSLIATTSQIVWSTNSVGAVVEDMPTWQEFTGQTTTETEGMGWLHAVHPNDRERVQQVWTSAVKAGTNHNIDYKVLRSDGEYRDMVVRGVPVVGKDGTIREWIGTATDVTEQRELEEQCRQSQKMEAMGRLAGGVSHDFNNIMGVIIGYSDLLLSSMSQDDLQRPKIEQIKKAGYRAAALTRQMLAFSRKQILLPKVLDLNNVVSDTSKLLSRVIGKNIELITRLDADLGRVRADPTQIDQVLMNLAINARDAMAGGGKLIIETKNTELDDSYGKSTQSNVRPGSYVLLTVSDTGIGMDKETKNRMFEPFFASKDIGKATGLGLATVYGIVKQSGGYIAVYSEVGKGTSFKVYLPRVNEAVTCKAAEKPLPLLVGAETILLVEDEVGLREVSHRLLESLGYTVLEAANSAEAINIAGRYHEPIDLLITDVVMPGMDGRQLAGSIVASRPAIRVLYMSGHAEDVILHYAILKPGVAFLQKPFTRDALAIQVRDILKKPGDATSEYVEACG
jgi:PAS domain S-box-containing protein